MTQLPSRRRRNIEGPVQDEIEHLILEKGWSAAQVHKHLTVDSDFDADKIPSERTIQRMKADLVGEDRSGRWSLASADGAELTDVAYVLKEVIEKTDGRIHGLTVLEAKWVHKIRQAAPEITGWWVWILSQLYKARDVRKVSDVADLDAFLMFEPWSSPDAYARYRRLVRLGQIEEVRPLLYYIEGGVEVSNEQM